MSLLKSAFHSSHVRKLASGSLIVFIGTMVANFFSYLYHVIVGRFLGPEKYAELASLLALLYIANVPTDSLRTVLTRYFATFKAKGETGEAVSLFWWMSKSLCIISVIGFLIIIPIVPYLSSFLHIQNEAYFYGLYFIFITGFITITNISFLLGYQLFIDSVLFVNIAALFRLFSGFIAPIYSVGGLLVATVAVNVVSYGSYFVGLRRFLRVTHKPFKLTKKETVSYSVPVVLATLGLTLIYNQDVVLVKHFFTPQLAGVYSALAVLGKIIFFASYAIGTVSFPLIVERKALESSYRKLVIASLSSAAIICVMIVSLYIAVPKLMIHLLFGQTYDLAASYLGIFGVFLSLFTLSTILTNICLAVGKVRVWVLPASAAITQQILINIFHSSLHQVIVTNIIVSGVLFLGLMLFFIYEKKSS